MELIEALEPPLFLIAMPQVADPFFNRSVVLLLEHTSDGSFGLIINRPLDLDIGSVVSDLGVSWLGDAEAVVYLGGPVQPTAGITLFGTTAEQFDKEHVREIVPGLRLANDTDTLKKLAETPPERMRLIVGYAGWTGGQLEEELGRNDWLLAPLDVNLVFESDANDIWKKALASIGIRPESLPSWTLVDEETSN